MQCVAVYCSVLLVDWACQCGDEPKGSVMQRGAEGCSVMQRVAACCSVLQRVALGLGMSMR